MHKPVVASVLIMFGALMGRAADTDGVSPTASDLPQCPVTGKPINFAHSTESGTGAIYFCSPDCAGKFLRDKAEYAPQIVAQREALAKRASMQTVCPITDRPVKKEFAVTREPQTIYACSQWCSNRIRANPNQYERKAARTRTYQTRCPVCEMEALAEHVARPTTEVNVYCCSAQCVKAFQDNPAQYAENLVKQGYVYAVLDKTAAANRTPSDAAGSNPAETPNPAVPVRLEQTSNDGTYLVTCAPKPSPIPLNQMFELEIRVFDARDPARALQGDAVAVDAAMPEHGHGMNTKPVVNANPDGSFTAQGMQFHMPGRWELYVDVTRGGMSERAQFQITLE